MDPQQQQLQQQQIPQPTVEEVVITETISVEDQELNLQREYNTANWKTKDSWITLFSLDFQQQCSSFMEQAILTPYELFVSDNTTVYRLLANKGVPIDAQVRVVSRLAEARAAWNRQQRVENTSLNQTNCPNFEKFAKYTDLKQSVLIEKFLLKVKCTRYHDMLRYHNTYNKPYKTLEDLLKVLESMIVDLDQTQFVMVFPEVTQQVVNLKRSSEPALTSVNLTINKDKCHFFTTKVPIVGFWVESEGIRPNYNKLAIMKEWTKPTTRKQLQSYLGIINFFRRFIPNVTTAIFIY
jgi:hypothetical protein